MVLLLFLYLASVKIFNIMMGIPLQTDLMKVRLVPSVSCYPVYSMNVQVLVSHAEQTLEFPVQIRLLWTFIRWLENVRIHLQQSEIQGNLME